MAFQGEFGAFSEEAVRRACGPEAEAVPLRTLRDVFDAVRSGDAQFGVIPVENSRAGIIPESYDLLLEHPLWVRAEATVPVTQCLLAPPATSLRELRRVYSHPQALAQCEGYLRRLGLEAIAVYDTAGSARQIAQAREPGAAAIASRRAAQLYGLEVLADAIQDDRDNTTRFYVIGREPTAAAAADQPHRTVLVLAMDADDSPGALHWSLGTLAFWRVNLLKIESRPSRRRPWHYDFYFELAARAEDASVRAALDELRARGANLRLLGSFPRAGAD